MGGLGELAAAAARPGRSRGTIIGVRQRLPWPHAGGSREKGEGKGEVAAGGRVSPELHGCGRGALARPYR